MAAMNILFAIGSLETGGAENQLALLAGCLAAEGHRVTVFSFQDGGSLKSRLQEAGVFVTSGGMKPGDMRRAPWKLLPAQFRLFKAVRRKRPDVIHGFLPLITFLAAFAGKLCGVQRIVTSRRALGNHQDRYPVLFFPDLLSNMLSDWITVNSAGVGQDLIRRERIGSKKIVHIYNGVETKRFSQASVDRKRLRQEKGLNPSAPVVITVANLIPYKGHHDLLLAAKTVIRQVPDACFLMVGEDRGIQSELEKMARSLGVNKNIVFFGGRTDVPELLAVSDLFVLPSHEEGFCNSLLEAMAAGLPVVATAVGGNPEAVANGETGWLVPARDADALAEKIIDLLANPDQSKKWGICGRERMAARFSVATMVNRHLALYRGRLRRKGHQPEMKKEGPLPARGDRLPASLKRKMI
jgi:glycosyltransferase involved in cell wall biosynthesis